MNRKNKVVANNSSKVTYVAKQHLPANNPHSMPQTLLSLPKTDCFNQAEGGCAIVPNSEQDSNTQSRS